MATATKCHLCLFIFDTQSIEFKRFLLTTHRILKTDLNSAHESYIPKEFS